MSLYGMREIEKRLEAEQRGELASLRAEVERLRAEVERWKTLAKQRAADWVLLRRQYEDLEDDRY